MFSNAEGAYGANVGMLIDSGAWTDEDEISQTFAQRKCFAYGRKGQSRAAAGAAAERARRPSISPTRTSTASNSASPRSTIISTASAAWAARRRGRAAGASRRSTSPTRRAARARCARSSEQVALETRTRVLNPKWYEGMLKHGYEGVRQIEAHVTNTMGWSATTGQVDPWVYERITETFVLDPEMRKRLAELNPGGLGEAREPDRGSARARLLDARRRRRSRSCIEAGDEIEDRLEGVSPGMAA